MYVDSVPNRGSKPAILLRESWREGSRVRKRTVANLSDWEPEKVDLLRRVLRGEKLVPLEEAFEVEESLPHGHVAAVLGTLRSLGLERLLAPRRSRERDLVVAMITARVLNPRSKLATARGLDHATSLGDVLELGEVDVDELYPAMDWLLERQPQIEEGLAQRHLQEGALVMYDVTSTYFEGRHCPLGRIGYSRDGKKNSLQIVFGLMTDAEGRPLGVEVFEGNTADPRTLASLVEKLQGRFGLQRVVVVGDHGMITEARIQEDLRPRDLQWITSLRAPAIRRLAASGSLQLSLFDTQDLAEITDPAFPAERLIVCRNPLLGDERARKREELLQCTERELERVVAATRRRERPLRGQDKIGLRVGRVLGRFKVGKHFDFEITDTSLSYRRDPAAIDAEAALDGLYVIRTNVAAEVLSTHQAVQTYKNLSFAERAFRCLKTIDLKVRPIYHHLAGRVRAHVFLCALAYYVEWHMRQRLAPLLFDDEDPEAGRALRPSVVAPAQRSPATEKKARSQHTVGGLPVHGFRDLLEALQTLARSRVRTSVPGLPPFRTWTRPTHLQELAFDLLGVRPAM